MAMVTHTGIDFFVNLPLPLFFEYAEDITKIVKEVSNTNGNGK